MFLLNEHQSFKIAAKYSKCQDIEPLKSVHK